jgi:tungstate transport system substrate-binding protein
MRGILMLGVLAVLLTTALPALAQVAATESYGRGSRVFRLATGSPGELGLLRVLGEAFAAKYDARLDWIKAGSGESLEMLRAGQVDMIMVHAPAAEKNALAEGWAGQRVLIGSNEFFIVGPDGDPAGIKGATGAADAYKRIAAVKAKFFSRGDDSGTHKKEQGIWRQAQVEPAGDWYIVTKDFMTATLARANAEKGYFMTDSSTWAAENNLPGLAILFSGDKLLVNTYHTLVAPDGTTPGAATASAFVDFVASPEGQEIIRAFGISQCGAPLYNDAAYARKYDE